MASKIDLIVEKLVKDFLREINPNNPRSYDSVSNLNLEMFKLSDRKEILERYGDELFKIANSYHKNENKNRFLITEIKKAYTIAEHHCPAKAGVCGSPRKLDQIADFLEKNYDTRIHT